MQHISQVLARPPPLVSGSLAIPAFAPWPCAAEIAHAIARAETDRPATIRQLRRVCQLLTSHTVRERERRRALLRLTRGCTGQQASAMLDYFIPTVRARTAEAARAPPVRLAA